MKTILSAIALTIALPAFAFAQADAPAGHGQHQGDMEHGEHHGSKDCCEGKTDCCDKMKAEGKPMECCEKHAKTADEKPAADPHAEHQGH